MNIDQHFNKCLSYQGLVDPKPSHIYYYRLSAICTNAIYVPHIVYGSYYGNSVALPLGQAACRLAQSVP